MDSDSMDSLDWSVNTYEAYKAHHDVEPEGTLEIPLVRAATPSPPSPVEADNNLSSIIRLKNGKAISSQLQAKVDSFGDDFLEICVTFTEHNRLNYKEATLQYIVEGGIKLAVKNRRCKPEWLLIPEYSGVGNMHYHGMLKGFNGPALAALKRILNHTCGRTCIHMVKYPESYKKYIFKDYDKKISKYIVYNHGIQ